MSKILLNIAYNGDGFHGWQKQKTLSLTIQEYVEAALCKIANEPVKVICAGRTDAGVHASNQFVHFSPTHARQSSAWTLGTNSHLPRSIRIKAAAPVTEDFHARYSATARTYRYIIYASSKKSAFMPHLATWVHQKLDLEAMHTAAQYCVGRHDFTSFRSAQCQAKTPVRTISHIKAYRQGDFLMFELKANAFLHHMVRNIMGLLLHIGAGKASVDSMQDVLCQKSRSASTVMASPSGLYLAQVDYPVHFNVPQDLPGPDWFLGGLGI